MNCLINIQQMAMRKETALVVTEMLGIVGKKEETLHLDLGRVGYSVRCLQYSWLSLTTFHHKPLEFLNRFLTGSNASQFWC